MQDEKHWERRARRAEGLLAQLEKSGALPPGWREAVWQVLVDAEHDENLAPAQLRKHEDKAGAPS